MNAAIEGDYSPVLLISFDHIRSLEDTQAVILPRVCCQWRNDTSN